MQTETNSTTESSIQFPVVGIGASAGGLAAFKLFIQSIPEKSNMAYVFVQHLSPTHESNLSEILQKLSKIPVELIFDNVKLQPDHIYVIPPDKALVAVDGSLKVEPIKNKRLKTIDLFFSSLGVVHQDLAVGVVLSGALNDGTLGLQVIKANGGLTFAQSEEAAAYNSMPKNAIDSGAVDFVLPAEEIIPKLLTINHPFGNSYSKAEIKRKRPEDDEEAYKQLLTVLRVRKGVDFSNYKQSTVKRRIVRRMALNKMEKPLEYLAFLRENKSEQDALYTDMLISVTNFFRDRKFFDLLCGIILPGLLTEKSVNDPLRIWVAGCATGEEAYTFAICILEHLGEKATAKKIQIFATDVSENAISKARTGKYKETEMGGLSTTQIQRFFNKVDGGFQVNKAIRDICIFANHNLLKDPPFSNIDLVSCRNVLIYFEPVLQKRALATFHYGLNQKGYLMLGKSESIGTSTDLFEPSYLAEKVYQAKGTRGRYRNITSPRNEQTMHDYDKDVQDHGEKSLQTAVQELLLKSYTPPGVLVNSTFDVVEFRGKTDTWLFVPPGKPSFNILKLAREGLSFEIRSLLHAAKTKRISARKEGIFFKMNNVQQYVDIEVVPVLETNEEHYLILFQQNNSIILDHNSGTEIEYSGDLKAYIARNEQLEKELTQTREDMRAITEAQEAANEELQSANEELLSGNEELQSLNEELESSKEELQSTNEEITIVNTELLDRNEQLNNSRKYTEEIFNTIHDPLIILDRSLKVLRATEGYYQLFKITDDTEGRYFYDLNNKVWDVPELRKQLEEILPQQGFFKEFEVEGNFRLIGRKNMMLTARQYDTHNHETLTLMAIHDITDKRKVEKGLAEAERLLAESRERLQFAVDSAGIGAWDFNPVSKELICDKKCKELHGLPTDSTLTYAELLELIPEEDRSVLETTIEVTLQQPEDAEFNVLYRVNGEAPERPKWLKLKGKAYFNEENIATRLVGTVVDNTIEKRLQEETKELLRKKDEFISIASHELKTPITSIKALLQVVERSIAKNDPVNTEMMVQKATRQVNKLVDLITELLDVTKIHAGKLDLNISDFSIVQLIEECVEQVHDKNKGQQIEIDGASALLVHADRARVEQVIMNLINNAIKYSPDSDHMNIRVIEEDAHVKVSITDYGIGIPKDKIPQIFQRFFRVQENSRSFAGLGLGLYISAEIIKRHHGEMGLDSEVDKGSTFWFKIPKLEESSDVGK
jgi:two-component system CheB/CheR fusion protein